jgi:CPA1 family monovalent cation:H+ antiporter
LQQRCYFAFEPITDFYTLQQRLSDGWTVQTARLSKDFDLDRLKSRLGELGNDWLLLGSVSPQGELQIYSNEPALQTRNRLDVALFCVRAGNHGSSCYGKQPTESHESPE